MPVKRNCDACLLGVHAGCDHAYIRTTEGGMTANYVCMCACNRGEQIGIPVPRLSEPRAMSNPDCPFCRILAGDAPAELLDQRVHTITIRPLNPVVPGHVLVIPRVHTTDAADNPAVTGRACQDAAEYARRRYDTFNLITSTGQAATQTVPHLHVHVIPRTDGDGLHLPWTGQDTP